MITKESIKKFFYPLIVSGVLCVQQQSAAQSLVDTLNKKDETSFWIEQWWEPQTLKEANLTEMVFDYGQQKRNRDKILFSAKNIFLLHQLKNNIVWKTYILMINADNGEWWFYIDKKKDKGYFIGVCKISRKNGNRQQELEIALTQENDTNNWKDTSLEEKEFHLTKEELTRILESDFYRFIRSGFDASNVDYNIEKVDSFILTHFYNPDIFTPIITRLFKARLIAERLEHRRKIKNDIIKNPANLEITIIRNLDGSASFKIHTSNFDPKWSKKEELDHGVIINL
jgi:hypothetical protein